MLPVRVSQSLNLQYGAFTVLVFHTAVFLSLIHSCRGQHKVVGPSQPIVAMVGEDVILPCHLDPVMDAFNMVLEWGRPDLDPRYVLVRRDGKELESMKHPSYEGRTSLFIDQLKQGNISLKLSKVKLSDEGRYRFFSPQLGETAVQLVVSPSGSSSSAPIIIGSVVGIIMLVLAVVFVVWKWRQNKIRNKKHHEDEESNSISNNSEQESLMGRETDRGQLTAERETTNNVDEEQTGLQSQTVEETHQRESDRAQCAVSEGTELQFSVEGERQTDQPLAEGDEGQEETETKPINKRRDPLNPTERQTENNLQTEEEEEEKIQSADNETEERETLNDKEKENLLKKLKAKEREVEKFEERVSRYKTQIKDREEQINEVKEQLEEVERQREQTERKLQSVNREEDQMDPETQKEAAEEDEAVMKDLERKKAELQKELEKNQRLLEGMKRDESVMAQRKMKAIKEKEKINKKLSPEKAESQSDSEEDL